MDLSAEIRQRIESEFEAQERQPVADALGGYEWPEMEPDRVHGIVLDLAKGQLSEVERLMKVANDNPRRVLAADAPLNRMSAEKKRSLTRTILILVAINVVTWIILKFVVQFSER